MNTVEKIVKKLDMLPHPEGGFYKETYRSKEVVPKEVLGKNFSGDRAYCTAIYFLLTAQHFSAFHKIKQDELWHYYDGDSLYVHVIDANGVYTRHVVGRDICNGESPQLLVKAGDWFASSVRNEKGYSLVGCTVAPGFDFDDFELADRAALLLIFPQYTEVITAYTRI